MGKNWSLKSRHDCGSLSPRMVAHLRHSLGPAGNRDAMADRPQIAATAVRRIRPIWTRPPRPVSSGVKRRDRRQHETRGIMQSPARSASVPDHCFAYFQPGAIELCHQQEIPSSMAERPRWDSGILFTHAGRMRSRSKPNHAGKRILHGPAEIRAATHHLIFDFRQMARDRVQSGARAGARTGARGVEG